MQPAMAVERRLFLWETPSGMLQIRPKLIGRSSFLAQDSVEFPADERLSSALLSVYGREMTPRSVRPFTKNCIASATSSNPMIRTRIRMPVSPRTALTRPAPASTK